MFGFLTDAIDNALDVADRVVSGEDVSRRQLAKLASDVTVGVAGAALLSEGADLLRELLSEDEQ